MTEILIDTNVLVYSVDPAEAEKCDQALSVLSKLQESQLGCLSVQAVSEFFNATTRGKTPKLTHQEALSQTEALLFSFPVFPLTPRIILEAARAVRDYSIAFYDAQMWACAKLNDIPIIFSEDFQDGQTLEGVRFVNPFSENFEIKQWL